MSKWIAEFELEDGDTMPEHMDLEYKGGRIDFHCKPLEQEPFINKPCVSSGVCEHDKNKALDKIRAEILRISTYKKRAEILRISSYEGFELGGVKEGYRIAMVNVLNIIDKYKAESEE